MVSTLILFIVLFFSCLSYAGEWQEARLYMFSGGEITAPASRACATSTTLVDGTTVSACDNFEGAISCADDALAQSNCFLTWAVVSCTSGTITNVAAGLEGTNAKSLDAANLAYCSSKTVLASAVDAANIFIRFKITTLTWTSTTAYSAVRMMADGGADTLCGIGLVYETDKVKFLGFANGAALATIASPLPAAGTEYYLWLEYVKNTATTGCKIYLATTATKPAVTQQGTTGNTQFKDFQVRSDHNAEANSLADPIIFDRLIIDTDTLGSDVP